MTTRKTKDYIVIWQPLTFPTSVHQMKVIDAFSSAGSLAEMRGTVEALAGNGHYSSHGEGLVTVAEKPSNTYRILGPQYFQRDESDNDQVVARINGHGVTRAQLSKVFDKVADKANWKNPINATAYLSDEEKEMLAKAITFFTGSVAKFERRGKRNGQSRYHVYADGIHQGRAGT